jgi:hypothetical protein
VMDRLAVPAPDGDVLAPFREARPVRAEREPAVFFADRQAGRVFQVPGGLPGKRPRFEPRNMDFGEGLDRWDLDSFARDLVEEAAAQAGLRLEILRKGWRIEADRWVERTVNVTGSQDWSRREITVTVPEETDVIRFGITLAGRGRVWLRNPELRREHTQDAGSAGVG